MLPEVLSNVVFPWIQTLTVWRMVAEIIVNNESKMRGLILWRPEFASHARWPILRSRKWIAAKPEEQGVRATRALRFYCFSYWEIERSVSHVKKVARDERVQWKFWYRWNRMGCFDENSKDRAILFRWSVTMRHKLIEECMLCDVATAELLIQGRLGRLVSVCNEGPKEDRLLTLRLL